MLLDIILGAAKLIGEVVAAGGDSAANDSRCSASDRELGNEIKESSLNFVDTINKFKDRLDD